MPTRFPYQMVFVSSKCNTTCRLNATQRVSQVDQKLYLSSSKVLVGIILLNCFIYSNIQTTEMVKYLSFNKNLLTNLPAITYAFVNVVLDMDDHIIEVSLPCAVLAAIVVQD